MMRACDCRELLILVCAEMARAEYWLVDEAKLVYQYVLPLSG